MLIYIEGNIGCGKSTLLKTLSNYFKDEKFAFITEPVDEWIQYKDSQGDNILDKFYKDQEKWSFPFQMNAFISRIHKTEQNKKEINLIERSVYTDKHCFAQNCFESGVMSEIEYNVYCKWHDWLVESFNIKPDGFIYLKTTVAVCNSRINKRARDEEDSIPIEYLEGLHNKHEEWMEKINVPILKVDANKDYLDNAKNINELCIKIKNFIEELSIK